MVRSIAFLAIGLATGILGTLILSNGSDASNLDRNSLIGYEWFTEVDNEYTSYIQLFEDGSVKARSTSLDEELWSVSGTYELRDHLLRMDTDKIAGEGRLISEIKIYQPEENILLVYSIPAQEMYLYRRSSH